ncbi:hypothetical protein DLAC_11148 [Tieghemostelium lacteum]|uniref:Ubiquinol-cytochrome c chaperone domain-containing protein n=1 Tax=Tieghemostelium lacteum TaxID=361077 RepID=A0A151Z3A3_TIELA|nr:hypothetical protein DLAC_11148 [Tieghemostelium lacteum]|eukprot:KYQ88443.1 hypothetical protein DLAC_11148 [Tieghemostelium lacteum]
MFKIINNGGFVRLFQKNSILSINRLNRGIGYNGISKSILFYSTNNNNTSTTSATNVYNPENPILKHKPAIKLFSDEELHNETKQKWYYKLMGIYSTNTKSLHASFQIYQTISNQASNISFYKEFNLPINVRSWFVVTLLHVWMVLVRLRKDGEASKQLSTDIYDRFWDDLGQKIVVGGINQRFVGKYLKEFYNTYLGSVVSYDEALFDDSILANSLWRNYFAMSEDVQPKDLLMMVKYIRYELNHLDKIQNITTTGKLTFHDIKTVMDLK